MVDLKRKSRELIKNPADMVKNFHNVRLGGLWGLGWSGGGKLEGQNYRFEIGAPKLLNNSTTLPPLKTDNSRPDPLFLEEFCDNTQSGAVAIDNISCFYVKSSIYLNK